MDRELLRLRLRTIDSCLITPAYYLLILMAVGRRDSGDGAVGAVGRELLRLALMN